MYNYVHMIHIHTQISIVIEYRESVGVKITIAILYFIDNISQIIPMFLSVAYIILDDKPICYAVSLIDTSFLFKWLYYATSYY